MNNIEKLKACLPSIPDMAPGLKKETDNSLCGPCPLCGGTDRFVYKTDEQKFWCRHCKPKGGDVIDLYRLIHNKTLPELFDEFGINNDHKSKPSLKLQKEVPSKKNLYSQQDRWKNILNDKNTNLDPIYRLAKRRGINKELFLKAYNDNKIRFVKHHLKDQEEISSVACQYCELDSDKKVLAIQMLSVDGLSYSDTEKKDKVFTYGSENEEGCFFQIGENIEQAKIIILFESVINAFSCTECFPSACCLAIGSSIYTKKIKSLRKYRDNDIQIICFLDNDKEGQKALDRISIILGEKTKTVKWPENTPNKYDINDLLKDGKHKDIISMINNAEFVKIDAVGTEEEADDQIETLNKTHAIVGIGDKICILHELINEKRKLELKFMTEYSFSLKYRNKEIPNPLAGLKGQSKTIPLATAWLKSFKRRCYDKVVFAPKGVSKRFYNLYQGLAYDPIQGDWSLFRDHLFKNICKGNIFHFDWLMSWMARIVQKPGGERPGTVVVLKGAKGTGKDVFVQAFGKIFGDHFLEVSSQDHIVGKFNNHLRSIILLFANEAWFAGDKAVEGAFKRLITSSSMVIEPKGLDAFSVDNHLNCIVASDGDWVVPVGDNERRFFILDVSKAHLQDLKYFKAIDDQMYHKGGISAFLYDLMQIDYKRHVLRQAPKTEALVYQATLNFSPFQKFWYNILQDGPEWPWHSEGRIETKKLHEQYIDFCKNLNFQYRIDNVIFGKFISKYNKIHDETVLKEQQMINGDRIFFYNFPKKDECKKKFCQVINNEIEFEDEKSFDINDI